jgi:tRNA/tmRNA/rRNA uracil-C5-methylase (TrmA/RlmC/RlmD family)
VEPGRRPAGPLLGHEVELDVGPVAHGGHCVARHAGRVVFVRHALPGERVVALVTEDGGGSYCRADAVRVLQPSPDRVPAPCPHAGPGRCGGCDWQHATGPAQRELKAAVVREQLHRLAGLSDVDVVVEPLPGGLLGWRSRVRFAVAPDGRTGLRRHRSHHVQPIAVCPLGTDEVDAVGAGRRRWPGAESVAVTASSGGDRAVVVTPADRRAAPTVIGAAAVGERAAGRSWRVAVGGFWQVHPAAADTLAGCLADLLRPRSGETALDLYAGAGLFAGVLGTAVGSTGRVVAVESDRVAAADAAANLADLPWVTVRRGRVSPALLDRLDLAADLVVLDPPRAGAGPVVVGSLLRRRPRAVGYVACDPAALARDVRAADAAGYRLAAIRAFDLFPMTHHVECVALLTPADG